VMVIMSITHLISLIELLLPLSLLTVDIMRQSVLSFTVFYLHEPWIVLGKALQLRSHLSVLKVLVAA
jgi:hypothetical protein